MATHRELEAQIRFQLEQLAARNAHHDFEHLCRHLARLRICSNIVPATGPVSSGGDQGRDFETFEVALVDSPTSSLFAAQASGSNLAFACTIQKTRLSSKVKSDVHAIMGTGRPVDGIHFLCVADIAAAKRHELQEWATSEHSVALEIHDGQWITQELAQRDVFWIAQEYLGIAAQFFPESSPVDKSYTEIRKRWENAIPGSLAELLDVAYGLREAARNGGPNEDLSFWLERISPDVISAQLRKRAIYETAVASMRGKKTMEGLEGVITEYFVDVDQLARVSDLDDAVVMIGFCLGAAGQQSLMISLDEIRGYARKLRKRVDSLLLSAYSPGHKAQLLYLRGFAASLSGSNLDDLGECLASWEEAVDLAKDSPLFPLTSLADVVSVLVELVPEDEQLRFNPRLLVLADRVDELVRERYGSFAAASRCRDRAMILYKKGNLLGAIDQFHKARRAWFAEETLQGSILATLFLSKCHNELGLAVAGKYYALVAAWLALTTPDLNLRRFVPQGILMACESDYILGAWCSYLILAETGLGAFAQFGIEKDAASIDSEINTVLFHSGIVYAMAQLFVPELRTRIRQMVEDWDLADDLNDLLEAADMQWGAAEPSDARKALYEQGIYAPFSDSRSQRHVGFRALGIQWLLKWENRYETNVVGEHFAASLQVILADLAGFDLCLLPAAIHVDVQLGDATPSVAVSEGDSPGKWCVTLPEKQDENFDQCVFTSTTEILARSSAFSLEGVQEILEERLQMNLLDKLFCIRPFAKLLKDFVSEDTFLSFERTSCFAEGQDQEQGNEHPQLRAQGGLGPGYERSVQEAHIKDRYQNLCRSLEEFLPHLSSSGAFRATAASLREAGWKDWHILLATFNAIVNYLARQRCETDNTKTAAAFSKCSKELANVEVLRCTYPIPDEEISEEKLRSYLRHSMMATLLNTWELNINTRGIDLSAIERLLVNRYGYWEADVEHDDLGF